MSGHEHDWHYSGTDLPYGDPLAERIVIESGHSPRVVCSTCPDWFQDDAVVTARQGATLPPT